MTDNKDNNIIIYNTSGGKAKVSEVYDEYDKRRHLYDAKEEDRLDDSELLLLEQKMKKYCKKK